MHNIKICTLLLLRGKSIKAMDETRPPPPHRCLHDENISTAWKSQLNQGWVRQLSMYKRTHFHDVHFPWVTRLKAQRSNVQIILRLCDFSCLALFTLIYNLCPTVQREVDQTCWFCRQQESMAGFIHIDLQPMPHGSARGGPNVLVLSSTRQ
jgi:hypothetical protein